MVAAGAWYTAKITESTPECMDLRRAHDAPTLDQHAENMCSRTRVSASRAAFLQLSAAVCGAGLGASSLRKGRGGDPQGLQHPKPPPRHPKCWDARIQRPSASAVWTSRTSRR